MLGKWDPKLRMHSFARKWSRLSKSREKLSQLGDTEGAKVRVGRGGKVRAGRAQR